MVKINIDIVHSLLGYFTIIIMIISLFLSFFSGRMLYGLGSFNYFLIFWGSIHLFVLCFMTLSYLDMKILNKNLSKKIEDLKGEGK